jgi:hypothetical protein
MEKGFHTWTAAPKCPKEFRICERVSGDEPPIGRHNLDGQDLIASQAKRGNNAPMTTDTEPTTHHSHAAAPRADHGDVVPSHMIKHLPGLYPCPYSDRHSLVLAEGKAREELEAF